MTSIERRVYDVYLNPDEPSTDPFSTEGVTCHRVVVTHADQLRGELEGAKRGVSLDAGQNITSVIVWCALVRSKLYDRKYESFRDADCADIKSPRPPEVAVEPVPPTVEPSPFGSSSPTLSPDSSPIGSTPI